VDNNLTLRTTHLVTTKETVDEVLVYNLKEDIFHSIPLPTSFFSGNAKGVVVESEPQISTRQLDQKMYDRATLSGRGTLSVNSRIRRTSCGFPIHICYLIGLACPRRNFVLFQERRRSKL